MKSGELQKLILQQLALFSERYVSTREILHKINEITNKDYAYTTISTTLSRLVKKKLVIFEIQMKKGKKYKGYKLNNEATRFEIQSNLQQFVTRFGMIGVRHLGQIFNTDLSENELKEIQKMFDELEQI